MRDYTANIMICLLLMCVLPGVIGRAYPLQKPLGSEKEFADVEFVTDNAVHNSTLFIQTKGRGSLQGYGLRTEMVQPTAVNMDPKSVQWSGYLDTPTNNKHLFFWMFQSRKNFAQDPIFLWLQGGPAYSSMYGMLQQFGPKLMVYDEQFDPHYKLVDNNYALNAEATVIFLEQPAGTGFSYGKTVDTTYAAVEDIVAFLRLFYETFGKNLEKQEFHIAGPSYSGHTIPTLANRIAKDLSKVIKLSSVLIGNGEVDQLTQKESIYQMACDPNLSPDPQYLLTKEECLQMKASLDRCLQEIAACRKAPIDCDGWIDDPCWKGLVLYYWEKKNLDPYDLGNTRAFRTARSKVEELELLEKLLNEVWTDAQIGVDKSNLQGGKWQRVNDAVSHAFGPSGDKMKSFQGELDQLLQGGKVRVLLYAVSLPAFL